MSQKLQKFEKNQWFSMGVVSANNGERYSYIWADVARESIIIRYWPQQAWFQGFKWVAWKMKECFSVESFSGGGKLHYLKSTSMVWTTWCTVTIIKTCFFSTMPLHIARTSVYLKLFPTITTSILQLLDQSITDAFNLPTKKTLMLVHSKDRHRIKCK